MAQHPTNDGHCRLPDPSSCRCNAIGAPRARPRSACNVQREAPRGLAYYRYVGFQFTSTGVIKYVDNAIDAAFWCAPHALGCGLDAVCFRLFVALVQSYHIHTLSAIIHTFSASSMHTHIPTSTFHGSLPVTQIPLSIRFLRSSITVSRLSISIFRLSVPLFRLSVPLFRLSVPAVALHSLEGSTSASLPADPIRRNAATQCRLLRRVAPCSAICHATGCTLLRHLSRHRLHRVAPSGWTCC